MKMDIYNPYKKGSFYYWQFRDLTNGYARHTLKSLVQTASEYRKQSENFCAYSWSQMLDWEFKAKCAETVIKHKLSIVF